MIYLIYGLIIALVFILLVKFVKPKRIIPDPIEISNTCIEDKCCKVQSKPYTKITLTDIAKECKCSQSSVSRFINAEDVVSDDLQHCIITSIMKLSEDNPNSIIKISSNKALAKMLGFKITDINAYFNPNRECKVEEQITKAIKPFLNDRGTVCTL